MAMTVEEWGPVICMRLALRAGTCGAENDSADADRDELPPIKTEDQR
jgi:hypothetical protein